MPVNHLFSDFFPPTVVGLERLKMKSQLIKDFRSELRDFDNRTGVFCKDYIWVLAGVSLLFYLSSVLLIAN